MMLANGVGVRRDVISAYAWFALADGNGANGARERFEILLRDHIPRHCHYDAMKLVRDLREGPDGTPRPGRAAELALLAYPLTPELRRREERP